MAERVVLGLTVLMFAAGILVVTRDARPFLGIFPALVEAIFDR